MENSIKNTTPQPIRVWIVEDNVAFGRNAAAAIDASDGLHCTANFRCCEDALLALDETSMPQVILMDIGLPGMSGIEGIRRFRQQTTDVEIIVLTVFEEEDKILSAIREGASGYLLKSASLIEIAEAIRLALAGGSPLTPRIARRVLGFFTDPSAMRVDYRLTEREREILNSLVEGLSKKEIATRLGISFHTVDMHLRHVYEKLRVNSAASAVAKAVREKLV